MSGNVNRAVGPLRSPTMLALVNDWANLVTLLGLLLAIVALYFAACGMPAIALICGLWAVLCDWWDGRLARSLRIRHEAVKQFGGQLDSLIDLVSSGIVPSLILLETGGFRLAFLPGAFLIAACGAIRLSYFNLYGLESGTFYRGLPIVHNTPVLATLFLTATFIPPPTFAWIVYGVIVALAVANVGSFKFPKFHGTAYYVFTVLVVVLTVGLLATTPRLGAP